MAPLVVDAVKGGLHQQRHQEEEEETQNETLPTSKPERVRVRSRFTPRHHDYDAAGTLSLLVDKITGFYNQVPVEQAMAKVRRM